MCAVRASMLASLAAAILCVACSTHDDPSTDDAAIDAAAVCRAYSESGSASCRACRRAQCDDPARRCYGTRWASGDFASGGACAAYFGCACACAANDFACVDRCKPSLDANCRSCLASLVACERASCASCGNGDDAGVVDSGGAHDARGG